jgi:serine/threonine protein kinase
MALSRDRVLADGTSPHPWEQKAIEFIKSVLPNEHPYLLWGLVELVERSGRRHEIDALVLGLNALYLVEIKSHPARFAGNAVNWTYTFEGQPSRTMENPIVGAARKARALAGMLDREMVGRRPRVEPLVFLSDPKADPSGLDGAGRNGVVTRKTFLRAITEAEFPGALSSLQDRTLDAATAKNTALALHRLGLVASVGQRKLGDLLLGDLLDEGPGYQDHVARHEAIGYERRVRVYLVAQSSGDARREQLKRAATREARILSALSHPGVLRCHDFKAEGPTGGPCLVFEHDPAFERLDAYLARRPTLSFSARLDIVKRVGEAVAYCHHQGVLHRAIDPHAVLVRGGDEEGAVETRLFNFQLAKGADTQGTVHLAALSDMVVYRAPEVVEDPDKAQPASDVFSLGALAYFVLVGRAPADDLLARQALLEQHRRLSLAAASEALPPAPDALHGRYAEKIKNLDDLVGFATELSPALRCDRVTDWLDLLGQLRLDDDEGPAPDSAVAGDVLRSDEGTELLVECFLGSGSTARVFRVTGNDPRGNTLRGALKVSLSAEHDARLDAEAALLERLRGDRIVALLRRYVIAQRTALLLHDAGETLAEVLRAHGPVGLEVARDWGEDLLLAVERLEEVGALHKDIKPANLGLEAPDRRGRRHLLLFDFSLASAPDDAVEVGTPAYRDRFLAARGRWDAAADRFAAAITLYEMLTGTLPRWGADDVAVGTLDEVTLETERFESSLREALGAFFRKALARDPARRFADAHAMRDAWNRSFSPSPALAPVPAASATPAPDRSAPGPAPLPPPEGSPFAALSLSARARNALDRAGILDLAALVALPRAALEKLPGVGRETARELLALQQSLRAVATPPASQPPPPALSSGPDGPDGPDAAPDSVDAWIDRFVPAAARKAPPWVADVRALLGLDEAPPCTATELAARRGGNRQRVYLHLAQARGHWKADALLPRLQGLVRDALHGLGDVGPAESLAPAIAQACHGAVTPPADARGLRRALALVEIARATDDALVEDTLHGARWIAADRALLPVVRALGVTADALCAREVLPGADEARVAFAPHVDATPLARLPLERLVALAARASAGAACSARLELYPRGMEAARALRLCANVLVDSAYPEDRLRAVVARRYPDAQPLPPRPALDALVAEVLPLRFDAAADRFVRPPAEADTTSLTALPPQRVVPAVRALGPSASPRAVTFHDEAARDFDERIRVAALRRSFRVLSAEAVLAPVAAEALARRLDVPAQHIDRLLWAELCALADRDSIDRAVIVETDRRGPGGEDWLLLCDLARDAAEAVLARWHNHRAPLVLCDLGPVARYGLHGFVEGLLRLAQRDDGPAVLVVLARLPDGGDARIDGGPDLSLSLPNPNAAPRMAVPEAWLRALSA